MAQKRQPSGGTRAAAKPAGRRAARPRAVSTAAPVAADVPAAAAAVAVHTAGPFSLGSSLSIREVSERAAQLKALFAAGSAEVDAGQLESIDTAGVQLLLVAAAAARRRGLTLKLLGAASLNAGVADPLGLAGQLAASAEILS
jgi:anti-anti-sigma regulatory factor